VRRSLGNRLLERPADRLAPRGAGRLGDLRREHARARPRLDEPFLLKMMERFHDRERIDLKPHRRFTDTGQFVARLPVPAPQQGADLALDLRIDRHVVVEIDQDRKHHGFTKRFNFDVSA